jgi:hypothetical protein
VNNNTDSIKRSNKGDGMELTAKPTGRIRINNLKFNWFAEIQYCSTCDFAHGSYQVAAPEF